MLASLGQKLLPDLPQRGSLRDYFIADILATLQVRRCSGALKLTDGRRRKIIVFIRGRVSAVRSNLPQERTGEMLVRARWLRRAENECLLAKFLRSGGKARRYGQFLAQQSRLRPEALEQALKQNLKYRLLESLGWYRGEFEWLPSHEEFYELPGYVIDLVTIWRGLQRLLHGPEGEKSGRSSGEHYVEGRIEDLIIVELLQKLHRHGESGTLYLQGVGGKEKRIRLVCGRPAAVVSNSEDERLGQILIQHQCLTSEGLREALEKKGERLLGELLVAEGKISADLLRDHLQRQMVLRFLECLSWSAGRYFFERLQPQECRICHRRFLREAKDGESLCPDCGGYKQPAKTGESEIPGEETSAIENNNHKRRKTTKGTSGVTMKRRSSVSQIRQSVHPCRDCGRLIFSRSKVCPSCWIERRRQKDSRFRSILKKVNGTNK